MHFSLRIWLSALALGLCMLAVGTVPAGHAARGRASTCFAKIVQPVFQSLLQFLEPPVQSARLEYETAVFPYLEKPERNFHFLPEEV